jgi:hypothetical protein
MKISGLSGALSGLQNQRNAMEKAATQIAGAGLAPAVDARSGMQGELAAIEGSALLTGTLEALVARRMFTAAVRMAEVANEEVTQTMQTGGYGLAED